MTTSIIMGIIALYILWASLKIERLERELKPWRRRATLEAWGELERVVAARGQLFGMAVEDPTTGQTLRWFSAVQASRSRPLTMGELLRGAD